MQYAADYQKCTKSHNSAIQMENIQNVSENLILIHIHINIDIE